jgi:hypothetical protein
LKEKINLNNESIKEEYDVKILEKDKLIKTLEN